MLTAQKYYANPANRRRALYCARGNSCVRVPGQLWALRLRVCPDGGGTWAVDDKTGERTGAFFLDRFPDGWRKLERPARQYRPQICDWYADNECRETIRPHVLQLPSRGGEVLYVPAVDHSDADGVTLYLGDVIRGAAGGDSDTSDTIREAWGRANRCAELAAEEARDYDMRLQAEEECERLAEESAQLLAQILADRAALAAFPFAEERGTYAAHARAAEALESRIDDARESRRANFARRRELRASPWLVLEGR